MIRGSRKVATLGPGLFGDDVSLYNGALTFTQTEASLPGNSELPVRVGRRLMTGAKRTSAGAFGDWELDIPHLKGVFSYTAGWNVGSVSGPTDLRRCSNYDPPADALTQTGSALVPASEFWFGNQMYVPGVGEQEILGWNGVSTRPTDGQTYPLVTKGGWVFKCILSGLPRGQAGEGFIATSPDGTQYRFDWLVSRPYAPYTAPGGVDLRAAAPGTKSTAAGLGGITPNVAMGWTLLRSEVWLMPTLVTDRFGNTVTYAYSATRPWRLQSITASDGRSITLGYDATTDLVRSVNDGTRTWTYSYNGNRLTAVTLPDGANWLFTGDSLQANPSYTAAPGVCDSPGYFPAGSRTMTMTHPSGALGSFTLSQTMRAAAPTCPTTACPHRVPW